MKARASRSKSYEQPGKGIESERLRYHPYSKGKDKVRETSQPHGGLISEKESMAPPKQQSFVHTM